MPEKGTYCVIFALYKGNTLVGAEMADVEFTGADEQFVPMSTSADDADSVKVMLWEMNSMQPLCKSDEKEIRKEGF